MFEIAGAKALEIVARVAIVYVGCMILLRLGNRREMSELGPMDLLTMLLLSETVSPALTGGDDSLPAGGVAAVTLFLMTTLTSNLAFRSGRFERLIQGKAAVLIRDGVLSPTVLRRYRITDDDLRNALHQQGLMSVKQVARAFIETDGKITIIEVKDD